MRTSVRPICSHSHANDPRFLALAPTVGNNIADLSRFFMDQLYNVMQSVNSKRRQLSSKLTCHLAITEYGSKNYDLGSSFPSTSTSSRKDRDIIINLDEGKLCLNPNSSRKFVGTTIVSHGSHHNVRRSDAIEGDDAYEEVLQVNATHDAIMAYYYKDEHNKVKVMEIFDVTESDSNAFQSAVERENNMHLQFDDDWDESTWTSSTANATDSIEYGQHFSEYSLENILERDSPIIFSDPESEWTGTFKVEEPEDDLFDDGRSEEDLPESDHIQQLYKIQDVTPLFNIDNES